MTTPTAPPVVFARTTSVGVLTVEPLDVERDTDLLYSWVSHPRSVFWQLGAATPEEVRRAYTEIVADPHTNAWLGRRDGRPLFLVETYDPAVHELAGHLAVRPGDIGLHLLVAPPGPGDPAVPGLTSAVMAVAVAFALDDPRHDRVVVEPDARNTAIHTKNAQAGFVVVGRARLSTKDALLATCTRTQFRGGALAGLLHDEGERGDEPTDVVHPPHLSPELMAAAHRHLAAKALGEYAHERLISPVPDQPSGARPDHDHAGASRVDASASGPADGVARAWRLDVKDARYRFVARRYALDHWLVDPDSIERFVGGRPAPIDAQDLIGELHDVLGIPEQLLGTYLEEVAATLAGHCWKLHHAAGRRVGELVDGAFQDVERAMTEGHPAFVANNGRIGFGLADHEAYAPEAGRPVRLVWLAVRRDASHLALGRGESEDSLYRGQLGGHLLQRFHDRLRAGGLDPADHLLLPVHPWQWQHKIAVTFAPDLAARRMVVLGEGEDRYQAQQSIRTFFDLDRPERHYVKTALSVQNMGFLRGLSPRYMRSTPAINDHVAALIEGDAELRACGLGVLRELAAVGYTGDAHHRWSPPGAHQRMVAALWRESPIPILAPGEQAMTMAALLHRDPDGKSLAGALIRSSGLDAGQWVSAYLHAYLRPLVHCLLAHDLAFMPHGENVILVLDDARPVRALMKDIGEEIALMHDRPLPADVERVRLRTSAEIRALALFTDVFDGFLRFLAGVLDLDGALRAQRFWQLVGECVAGHAVDHPELHERLDLFVARFGHSCLNRLQLRNTLQMVDLADQPSSLVFAGSLVNPIAETPRGRR